MLSDRFRPGAVFFDQYSIESGEEFPKSLRAAIRQSSIMLVLIGPDWLEAKDKRDRRRLDDPADFVRQEVQLALKLRKRILPVLFDDTPMPPAARLPRAIVKLASYNALSLRGRSFEYDAQLQELTELIGEALGGFGRFAAIRRYGAWRLLSPEWAFFLSIQADPTDPLRLYAGLSEGQGLYRSDDGGRSWGPAHPKLAGKNVRSDAVSALDGLVLVGTESGLWMSPDRDRSWVENPDYLDKSILSVAISPLDPDLALVGCQRPGGTSVSVSIAASGRLAAPVIRDGRRRAQGQRRWWRDLVHASDLREHQRYVARPGGQPPHRRRERGGRPVPGPRRRSELATGGVLPKGCAPSLRHDPAWFSPAAPRRNHGRRGLPERRLRSRLAACAGPPRDTNIGRPTALAI